MKCLSQVSVRSLITGLTVPAKPHLDGLMRDKQGMCQK